MFDWLRRLAAKKRSEKKPIPYVPYVGKSSYSPPPQSPDNTLQNMLLWGMLTDSHQQAAPMADTSPAPDAAPAQDYSPPATSHDSGSGNYDVGVSSDTGISYDSGSSFDSGGSFDSGSSYDGGSSL